MNVSFTQSERAKVATALRTAGYDPSEKNVDRVLAEVVGNMELEEFPDALKNVPSIADAVGARKVPMASDDELEYLGEGGSYYNVIDGRTMISFLTASDDPEVCYGAILPLEDACALAIEPGVEFFEDIRDGAEARGLVDGAAVVSLSPDEVPVRVPGILAEPGWIAASRNGVLAAGIAHIAELPAGMSAAGMSDFAPRLAARGITVIDRYETGLEDSASKSFVYNVLTKTLARVNSRSSIYGNTTTSTWTFPAEGPQYGDDEVHVQYGGRIADLCRSVVDEPGWGPCSRERVEASFGADLEAYPEDRRSDGRWSEERCPTYLTHGYLARDEDGSGIIGAVYETKDGGFDYCLAYGDASAPLVRGDDYEDDISETRHADTLDGAKLGLVELGTALAVSVRLATTEKVKATTVLSGADTLARLDAAATHTAAAAPVKAVTTHTNITR